MNKGNVNNVKEKTGFHQKIVYAIISLKIKFLFLQISQVGIV
jgi:hypothetical protein